MEIFYKLERLTNALETEKYKLKFPQYFNPIETSSEIDRLIQEINCITNDLNKIDGLEMKKDLMSMQLTEYIKQLNKSNPLQFSRSQNYIGNHYFYTKPYSDIKNILFNDLRGIMGVSLFLTNENSDVVTDAESFKNLLLEIRDNVIDASSMSELFKICEKFIEKIKQDFCPPSK